MGMNDGQSVIAMMCSERNALYLWESRVEVCHKLPGPGAHSNTPSPVFGWCKRFDKSHKHKFLFIPIDLLWGPEGPSDFFFV